MSFDTTSSVFLTAEQARRVDRLAIESYGVPGIVLMENAARGCADWMLGQSARRVVVLCGSGNNGGDGLAIARHLTNAGVQVVILLTASEDRYSGDAQINLSICRRLALPLYPCPASEGEARRWCGETIARLAPDWIVDAMLGTGALGAPRGAIAGAIAAANESQVPIVAVDVPSGWECQFGRPLDPCIRATYTLTMVAPKVGFDQPSHRVWIGQWRVIGIGIPVWLVGLAVSKESGEAKSSTVES